MRPVLLFGASGFLGAHVRVALQPHVPLHCPGRDRCDLLTVEVGELAARLRATGVGTVVNCTGRLDGSVAELVSANTMVTAKLIDAVERVDPRIRLVRIGSAGEYGPVPHGLAAKEDGPATPVSEYGVSHLAATTLLEVASRRHRVDGVTLRVFNPVGTGQRGANLLGRAAERMATALATGAGSITLGPLTSHRDFVDARDVAAAVAAVVAAPHVPARVVNIGSGRAVATRGAVEMLARVAGFRGEVREEYSGSARSAGVDWMLADIDRARKAIGWRPVYRLADTIEAIWAELRPAAQGSPR